MESTWARIVRTYGLLTDRVFSGDFRNTRRMILAGSVSGLFIFAASLELHPEHAKAQAQSTECFRYRSHDTPYANTENEEHSEVWCYRSLSQPSGAKMIFQIDEQGKTTPELSFVVENDGSITHASLQQGTLTVHNVRGNFVPIPVPLTPPPNAERVAHPLTPSSTASTDNALHVLTTSQINRQDVSVRFSGMFEAQVAPASLPWRGYWFPYSSGRLHNGADSPMAKFDRMVIARTGVNPGAQWWEKRGHGYEGINWAGHCNGWAAASILRKEPSRPWTDPMSGITFTVGDQKGLLIERDYCPKFAFFGHRYSGPNSNIRDIPADLFHKTIRYYLGELGKPVLMDLMSNEPVENRVVSGYKMQIDTAGRNAYIVTVKANVHTYDLKLTDDQGPAPAVEKIYKYKLWTDSEGNITQGSWISQNPDFLWVPISPGRECKSTNPALNEAWVGAIGNGIMMPW